MLHQIHSDKQKIEKLFKKAENISDDELKSHWSRYLCVLTSGLIENSFRLIISDFARKNSSPIIQDYITKKIESTTNLKYKNICELLNSFSSNWKETFETTITDEQIDAINSVVANRHLIAHGRNVGISYVTMNKYYKEVAKCIELAHGIINKHI